MEKSREFRLGPLGTLNQVVKALAKVIRAMASGEIDSAKGARLANALGILRAAIEGQKLDRIEERLNALEDPLHAPPAGQERRATLQ
jgi:hypothetical protein